MNQSRSVGYGLAVVFIVLAAFGVTAAHADAENKGETPLAGWYISVGVGANRAATLGQDGDNRDTTCYPTRDCGHLPGGMPAGFRWFYDMNPDTGTAFELAVGRTFRPLRLELSLSSQTFDLEQEFAGLTYLHGADVLPAADSAYASSAMGGVDGMTLHSLSLNAYYDLPLPETRLTPYVGAGLGVTFAELSGLRFTETFSCTDTSRCDNPERYNGSQDVDMKDTVGSLHLHAGADYSLTERLLMGVKVSYTFVEDMEERHAYSDHAIPGMTNAARVTGISYGSLMVTFKYLLAGAPGAAR